MEKVNYNGPVVLDMFPYREDPLSAARESIELIKQIRNALKDINEKEIENILKNQDATRSMKFLRNYFLK